jgi:hypothetical protein
VSKNLPPGGAATILLSVAGMMRPLLALAMLLSLVGPAVAQSTWVLRQPDGGYIVVPPSGPVGQIVPAPGGGFMVVAPAGPPTAARSGFFAIAPKNGGGSMSVPSDGDQSDNGVWPCCSPP